MEFVRHSPVIVQSLKKKIYPTESSIQSSFIIWINLQYPDIADVTCSFANSGKRDPKYGRRLKREGLRKGFPDLGIFYPSGEHHGMFIEFKTSKGILTKEQKDILKKLSSQGYVCVVCKSLEGAIKETIKYLSLSYKN